MLSSNYVKLFDHILIQTSIFCKILIKISETLLQTLKKLHMCMEHTTIAVPAAHKSAAKQIREVTPESTYLLIIPLIPLCFTCGVNILVIILTTRHKNLQSVSGIYVSSLAMADIIVGHGW